MKSINFARQWPRIEPLLNDREIKFALHFGLFIQNPENYRAGDPPWLEGRGPLNGQRARQGKLSWYQPWGRCHAIAPFAWAVAKRLYPRHRWGFLSSERHTIAVGLNAHDEIKMVADILLFKSHNAEQSIAFVSSDAASLCFNPGELNTGQGWAETWEELSKALDQCRTTTPNARSHPEVAP
jgi:hypothetical protein